MCENPSHNASAQIFILSIANVEIREEHITVKYMFGPRAHSLCVCFGDFRFSRNKICFKGKFVEIVVVNSCN